MAQLVACFAYAGHCVLCRLRGGAPLPLVRADALYALRSQFADLLAGVWRGAACRAVQDTVPGVGGGNALSLGRGGGDPAHGTAVCCGRLAWLYGWRGGRRLAVVAVGSARLGHGAALRRALFGEFVCTVVPYVAAVPFHMLPSQSNGALGEAHFCAQGLHLPHVFARTPDALSVFCRVFAVVSNSDGGATEACPSNCVLYARHFPHVVGARTRLDRATGGVGLCVVADNCEAPSGTTS